MITCTTRTSFQQNLSFPSLIPFTDPLHMKTTIYVWHLYPDTSHMGVVHIKHLQLLNTYLYLHIHCYIAIQKYNSYAINKAIHYNINLKFNMSSYVEVASYVFFDLCCKLLYDIFVLHSQLTAKRCDMVNKNVLGAKKWCGQEKQQRLKGII